MKAAEVTKEVEAMKLQEKEESPYELLPRYLDFRARVHHTQCCLVMNLIRRVLPTLRFTKYTGAMNGRICMAFGDETDAIFCMVEVHCPSEDTNTPIAPNTWSFKDGPYSIYSNKLCVFRGDMNLQELEETIEKAKAVRNIV